MPIGPTPVGCDLRSRDPGLIPSAGGHFCFGCCVLFILARSFRNGSKNTVGPLEPVPDNAHWMFAQPTC